MNAQLSASKRSSMKTSIACEFCRGRRVRCDGNMPCSQCAQRGRECEYSKEAPKKRGPKSKRDQMNSTVMQTLQSDKQVKHDIPKGAPVLNPPTFPQSAQPQNSALAADSGHINSRADASYSIIHSEIASVPNALQASYSHRELNSISQNQVNRGNQQATHNDKNLHIRLVYPPLNATQQLLQQSASHSSMIPPSDSAYNVHHNSDSVAPVGLDFEPHQPHKFRQQNGYALSEEPAQDRSHSIQYPPPYNFSSLSAPSTRKRNRSSAYFDSDNGESSDRATFATGPGRLPLISPTLPPSFANSPHNSLSSSSPSYTSAQPRRMSGGFPSPVAQELPLALPSPSPRPVDATLNTTRGFGTQESYTMTSSSFQASLSPITVPDLTNSPSLLSATVLHDLPTPPPPPVTPPPPQQQQQPQQQRQKHHFHYPHPSPEDFLAVEAYFLHLNPHTVGMVSKEEVYALLELWSQDKSGAHLLQPLPDSWWCAIPTRPGDAAYFPHYGNGQNDHGDDEDPEMDGEHSRNRKQYAADSAMSEKNTDGEDEDESALFLGGSLARYSSLGAGERGQIAMCYALLALGYRVCMIMPTGVPSHTIADRYFQRSRALALSAVDEPSLPLVSAFLMLSYYSLGVGRRAQCSIFASVSWRLARACGVKVNESGLGAACKLIRQVACPDLDILPLSRQVIHIPPSSLPSYESLLEELKDEPNALSPAPIQVIQASVNQTEKTHDAKTALTHVPNTSNTNTTAVVQPPEETNRPVSVPLHPLERGTIVVAAPTADTATSGATGVVVADTGVFDTTMAPVVQGLFCSPMELSEALPSLVVPVCPKKQQWNRLAIEAGSKQSASESVENGKTADRMDVEDESSKAELKLHPTPSEKNAAQHSVQLKAENKTPFSTGASKPAVPDIEDTAQSLGFCGDHSNHPTVEDPRDYLSDCATCALECPMKHLAQSNRTGVTVDSNSNTLTIHPFVLAADVNAPAVQVGDEPKTERDTNATDQMKLDPSAVRDSHSPLSWNLEVIPRGPNPEHGTEITSSSTYPAGATSSGNGDACSSGGACVSLRGNGSGCCNSKREVEYYAEFRSVNVNESGWGLEEGPRNNLETARAHVSIGYMACGNPCDSAEASKSETAEKAKNVKADPGSEEKPKLDEEELDWDDFDKPKESSLSSASSSASSTTKITSSHRAVPCNGCACSKKSATNSTTNADATPTDPSIPDLPITPGSTPGTAPSPPSLGDPSPPPDGVEESLACMLPCGKLARISAITLCRGHGVQEDSVVPLTSHQCSPGCALPFLQPNLPEITSTYLDLRAQELTAYAYSKLQWVGQGNAGKTRLSTLRTSVWPAVNEALYIVRTLLPDHTLELHKEREVTLLGMKALCEWQERNICPPEQKALQDKKCRAWVSLTVKKWKEIPMSTRSYSFLVAFIARHVALIALHYEVTDRANLIKQNYLRERTLANQLNSDSAETTALVLPEASSPSTTSTSASSAPWNLPALDSYPCFVTLATVVYLTGQHWPLYAQKYALLIAEAKAIRAAEVDATRYFFTSLYPSLAASYSSRNGTLPNVGLASAGSLTAEGDARSVGFFSTEVTQSQSQNGATIGANQPASSNIANNGVHSSSASGLIGASNTALQHLQTSSTGPSGSTQPLTSYPNTPTCSSTSTTSTNNSPFSTSTSSSDSSIASTPTTTSFGVPLPNFAPPAPFRAFRRTVTHPAMHRSTIHLLGPANYPVGYGRPPRQSPLRQEVLVRNAWTKMSQSQAQAQSPTGGSGSVTGSAVHANQAVSQPQNGTQVHAQDQSAANNTSHKKAVPDSSGIVLSAPNPSNTPFPLSVEPNELPSGLDILCSVLIQESSLRESYGSHPSANGPGASISPSSTSADRSVASFGSISSASESESAEPSAPSTPGSGLSSGWGTSKPGIGIGSDYSSSAWDDDESDLDEAKDTALGTLPAFVRVSVTARGYGKINEMLGGPATREFRHDRSPLPSSSSNASATALPQVAIPAPSPKRTRNTTPSHASLTSALSRKSSTEKLPLFHKGDHADDMSHPDAFFSVPDSTSHPRPPPLNISPSILGQTHPVSLPLAPPSPLSLPSGAVATASASADNHAFHRPRTLSDSSFGRPGGSSGGNDTSGAANGGYNSKPSWGDTTTADELFLSYSTTNSSRQGSMGAKSTPNQMPTPTQISLGSFPYDGKQQNPNHSIADLPQLSPFEIYHSPWGYSASGNASGIAHGNSFDTGRLSTQAYSRPGIDVNSSPCIGPLPSPKPYLTPQLLAQHGLPGAPLHILRPHGGSDHERHSLELLEGDMSPFVAGGL